MKKEEKVNTTPWHSLPLNETLKVLETSLSGLSDEQIKDRLRKYGENSLPTKPKKPAWLRFLGHFHNILIYVLIASAIITTLLGHYIDSVVIVAVVLANSIISHLQEGKAEKAMESIRHMLALKAAVIRDGKRTTIKGAELVPGDIVILEAGDKVPADIRLESASSFQIQEAILTGESVPVRKHADPVAEKAALGDRQCMLYSGTFVTNGLGKGVVVGTGSQTEIGRISGLIGEVETLTTPLVKQMDKFAKWLTFFILTIAALLLTFGSLFTDQNFKDLFMAIVGLSVAAIPEGLPAVLTITLAVGVQMMAKKNAIVRRLPAIETLGSVTTICTDKTGTLTKNEMMVATVVTDQGEFIIEGDGLEPKGDILHDGKLTAPEDITALGPLTYTLSLCNDASLIEKNNDYHVEGDPMEGALLSLSRKLGVPEDKLIVEKKRQAIIPFSSKLQFMATLHESDDTTLIAYVKGAPEKIISMCSYQLTGDMASESKEIDINYWKQKAEYIASKGQRVLALAQKNLPKEPNKELPASFDVPHIKSGLTLIGLVGMIDPPRSEVIDAVSECFNAGIGVKMITGDHKKTAMAIAEQIGIKNCDKALTGTELEQLDDNELKNVVQEVNIFARTTPEHKLRIVMALQALGQIVAMTGDGVNDAPALKRADAGIAMGLKGSEAAKESSELVLADDHFATIVSAIREGRTVYDNITKVISWTLPTNAGEALTIISALALGLALPITPIQILWVNLITAITLGLALAFEPTEKNTMKRAPRKSDESIINPHLLWHIILVSLLFLAGVFGIYNYALAQGYSIELARTMSLNTLVVMEIFHLFFIRNIYGTSLNLNTIKGTKVVWGTTLGVTAAQFLITYLPPLQKVFQTEAVPISDGFLIVFIGIMLFAIIETEKQFRLRFF